MLVAWSETAQTPHAKDGSLGTADAHSQENSCEHMLVAWSVTARSLHAKDGSLCTADMQFTQGHMRISIILACFQKLGKYCLQRRANLQPHKDGCK